MISEALGTYLSQDDVRQRLGFSLELIPDRSIASDEVLKLS